MLLAIKAHDYENHCVPALRRGHIVFEGRSLHCVAVYQSLIMHPRDDQAFDEMLAILGLAVRWRPLPDLTFLITDDPDVAARRAGQRDGRPLSPEYLPVHRRAAALYDLAVTSAPGNLLVIDRRQVSADEAVAVMKARIAESVQAAGRTLHPVLATDASMAQASNRRDRPA
jgi:dTMP kinase